MNSTRRTTLDLLLYGLFAGVLIVVLRLVEFRWLILENAAPIYTLIIAVFFAYLGLRLGHRMRKATTVEKVVVHEVRVPAGGPFTRDATAVERLGVTPRELDILELMATGLSNREIADRLFVSENTVKTHSSRLFDKLNARRRTQAVQIGKDRGLIP